ncbi:MAG: hypothetical protein RMY29_005150 [Nostoc sp. CreGUA01]|nr:hypothetical protein [Nostoc sp. CreGUA01]
MLVSVATKYCSNGYYCFCHFVIGDWALGIGHWALGKRQGSRGQGAEGKIFSPAPAPRPSSSSPSSPSSPHAQSPILLIL